MDTGRGQIAIGHNGNLTNAAQLREELEAEGSIFQTTVDSEIILHLLAQPRGSGAVLSALRRIEGAFSIVLMGEREILGFRDPYGFRPLCIGKKDDAYVLSSESCALDLIQAEYHPRGRTRRSGDHRQFRHPFGMAIPLDTERILHL